MFALGWIKEEVQKMKLIFMGQEQCKGDELYTAIIIPEQNSKSY